LKLTVEDLTALHEKVAGALALRQEASAAKIFVHMGDCGIQAGARKIMEVLLEELEALNRPDIHVYTAGCIQKCDKEPVVTVELKGASPIRYQKMDPEKMRRVLKEHVLQGRVQSDLVLPSA